MHHFFLLVIALAGSDWNCTESNGLWDCQPVQALPRTAARSLRSPAAAAPVIPVPPSASPPPAVAETPPASPAPEPSPAPAPEDATSVRLEDAFVVQIGAYRMRARAQEAAAQLTYDKLSIVPTERNGEIWYVLLLGAYPTVEAARAAGADYETLTGGSFWVRSGDDLQRVLAAPRESS